MGMKKVEGFEYDVRINGKNAEKDAYNIRKTVGNILSDTRDYKGLDKLQDTTRKTVKVVDNLKMHLRDLKDTDPTADFVNKLNADLRKSQEIVKDYAKQLEVLKEKRDTLGGSQVKSTEYAKLEDKKSVLEQTLDRAYGRMRSIEQSSDEVKSIQHLTALAEEFKRKGDVNNEMFATANRDALAETSEDYKIFKTAKLEAKELEEEIAKVQLRLKDMEEAGIAQVSGKTTKEYADILKEIEDIKRKANKELDNSDKMRESGLEKVAELEQKHQEEIESTNNTIQEKEELLSGLGAKYQEILRAGEQMANMERLASFNKLQSNIMTVIRVLDVFKDSLSEIRQRFIQVTSMIPKLFSGTVTAVNKVKQAIDSVVGSVSRVINIVKRFKKSFDSTAKTVGRKIKRGALMVAGLLIGARGLYRMLNKLKKGILSAFKTVAAQDPDFQGKLNTLKNMLEEVKIAFATAFMPVVLAILPYIKALLEWVLRLLAAVAQFIATVTGLQLYAKNIKAVGDAAKGANKQLSKFDELNNITTGSGSGSGGLVDIPDPEPIDDWFKFIRNIIDKLEKLLRAIPWEKIYKEADKFGYKIAKIFNAIFKPSFWNAIGMTIGGVLNTILHFFNTLGTHLRFDKIGQSIFQGIKGLLDMFDWELFSDTLIKWADGFWTIVKTVFTERDEDTELTLVERLTNMITNSLSMIPWEKIFAMAQDIGATFGEVINQIFNPDMFGQIGLAIGGLGNAILLALMSLADTIEFDRVGEAISNGIKNLLDAFSFSDLMGTIITWATGLWEIIRTVLTSTGENGKTLPQTIIDNFKEGLDGIEWSEIEPVLHSMAIVFTDTINNVFKDEELAKKVGSTIGQLIQNAIQLYADISGFIEWDSIGKMIGDMLNSVADEINGGTFSEPINNIFNGLLSVAKSIILTIDWGSVLEDIFSYIKGLDWKIKLAVIVPPIIKAIKRIGTILAPIIIKSIFDGTMAKAVSAVTGFFGKIQGVLSGFSNFFTTTFGGGTILEWIFGPLTAALGGYQIGNGIAQILALLVGDMEAFEDAEAISLPALFTKLLTGNDWDSGAWEEVWTEFFDNIVTFFTGGEVWEDLLNIGDNIIKGITEGISQYMDEDDSVFQGIFKWIFNGICKVFGIASPAKEMENVGENIILGILQGFGLVDFGQKISDWWNENIAPWFTLEKWNELVQPIKDSITTIWNDTVTFWTESVPVWWDEHVAPYFSVDTWTELVQPIYDKITSIWNTTKEWWDENIASWWDNSVAPWFTLDKWTELLAPIKDAFSTGFNAAVNVAIDALNSLIEALEKMINEGAIGGINGLIEWANRAPGVNIPTINAPVSLPRIPALASGTVIPPSMSEFIARLGDNNRETEVVSPLSTMKQALIEALQESGGSGGEYHIHIDLDGREVAKAVVKQNDMYKKSMGRSLFA